jgi:hypothetical protein
MVLEMILPEYTKQLLENYQSIYSQLASQLRWLYFDESFRLVVRAGYLDDGYIRLRLDGHWEFTGELLREMSWVLYSVAEVGRNVDMLKNALESVGVDRLRVVGDLTLSEMNVTRVGGVALTGRDWSQDFAKLQNLDVQLSSIKALLPSSLTSSGNFKIAIAEDAVGVAKDATLSAIKNALASVGADKVRVTVVDVLPRSPFYLTDSAGAELSGYVKNIDIALSAVRDLLRPITKASLFNASVTANTNIFSSSLTPTYSPSTFRIYATFSASGVLSVVRTVGSATVTEQLNSGNALNANCAYIFDIVVESGESINLRYSVNATALVLKVVEVPTGVS